MLFHQRNTCISFIFAVKFYASAIFSHARQLFSSATRQKRIWHVLAEGAVRNSEIDIHSNSRLDNDFHSTLVVYRKSFPIYGVAEQTRNMALGGKGKTKREKGTGISSILLLSGGHNNELTILHLLIQQMDYFKLHKHF